MQQEKLDQFLSDIKAPINHPLFLPRVFALTARYRKTESRNLANPIYQLFAEEYEELSRRLDRSHLQESCSVRNILRVRQLVNLLLDEKGDLNMPLVSQSIEYLKQNLYSLGPNRQHDAKRQEHLLRVLQLLDTNKELVRQFKKVSKPISNKLAEDYIRNTLQLSPNIALTDLHAKQAVLSAWLTYLRQNVGSCFATAPAEVVHDEQPELFLHDLTDLLGTGRLKRTFSGVEYAVPLSASWGAGDLKKPVVIQRRVDTFEPEIWYSPGLMAAFEEVGLLTKEDKAKEKVQLIKEWLLPILKQETNFQPYCIVTAEHLIRLVMLNAYELTEAQIKEYESRPKGMVQSQLIMQVHQPSKKTGGLGERCNHFLFQYEVAKNTFKALADNALLKAWEFTLASFSDTKYDFARWNLYASLGLQSNEPGGIGECIYGIIKRKLDIANKKVEDLNYECEMVYTQVKGIESRMRSASTEKEAQWIKIEYQSHVNEFYSLQETRDMAAEQARSLVDLYDALYEVYTKLFQDYFQEVYDADMQEVTTGPFDDSPAGFRLLYKHGRTNTSQWTRIRNQHEFVESLASFFVATEPQVASALESQGIPKDLSEVVTSVINHVKTKEFLESAFHRMAKAHNVPLVKDPLENLEHIEKKPWSFTSGGTMNTLVSCYYCIEDRPKEIEKWVESEMELMVFLVDTLKHVPAKLMEPYIQGKRSDMLMQSPTHAFLLKPNLTVFKEAWTTDEFTYTALRDKVVKPAEMFIEGLLLNEEMIAYLIEKLNEKIPENYQPRFKTAFSSLSGPLNPIFLRDYIVETMYNDRGLRYGRNPVLSPDEIDSFLYATLPVFPVYELKDRLKQLLMVLPGIDSRQIEDILSLYEQIPLSRTLSMISANQLQDICKALLCLQGLTTTTPLDYQLIISQAAQKLGFAMPSPFIFADTNWVKDMFGFVLNPGTGKLELWRLDYTGSIGHPMSIWKEWVNGSRPDRTWGIYVKPPEYGQN